MSITEVQFQATALGDAPAEAIEGRSQWQLTWRRLRSDHRRPQPMATHLAPPAQ